MPRTSKSPSITVLAFFRTAPIEQAEFILDLAKNEVKDRKNAKALRSAAHQGPKKRKAKKVTAAEASARSASSVSAPAARRKAGIAGRRKKRGSAAVTEEQLPPQGSVEEFEPEGEFVGVGEDD